MSNLNKLQADMLAEIAEATLDQTHGFAMVKNVVTSAMLAKAGLIELNQQMTEGDKIAARTTNAGVDKYQNGDNVEPVEADNETADEPSTNQGAKTMTEFAIETGVPALVIKRRGAANSIYPFDALEVGQSFFVPATDEMPNPGKSLASTVSSASKRYAKKIGTREITRKNRKTGEKETITVPTYTYERRFMVRSVEENGVKGARVWRIEPKEDDTDEGDDE